MNRRQQLIQELTKEVSARLNEQHSLNENYKETLRKRFIPIVLSALGLSGSAVGFLSSPAGKKEIQNNKEEIINTALDSGYSPEEVQEALSVIFPSVEDVERATTKDILNTSPIYALNPITVEEYAEKTLELSNNHQLLLQSLNEKFRTDMQRLRHMRSEQVMAIVNQIDNFIDLINRSVFADEKFLAEKEAIAKELNRVETYYDQKMEEIYEGFVENQSRQFLKHNENLKKLKSTPISGRN